MRYVKDVPRRGFTLVEILIVVILLGILAAIVIPQFSGVSHESRVSALLSNLQIIRSQRQLYKAKHEGAWPDKDLVDQLTKYTDADGETSDTPDSDHRLGPYLQTWPANSISGKSKVKVRKQPNQQFSPPPKDEGWWYNTATGEFRANLTDQWTYSDGTPLNQM